MDFFTYIMASGRIGTLYVGSTDDVLVRSAQHRMKVFRGFTAKHGVDRLVWFERHPTRVAAFKRERQIKKWKRGWKLRMIEEKNPVWNDLADQLRLDGLSDAEGWRPPQEAGDLDQDKQVDPRLRGDERNGD